MNTKEQKKPQLKKLGEIIVLFCLSAVLLVNNQIVFAKEDDPPIEPDPCVTQDPNNLDDCDRHRDPPVNMSREMNRGDSTVNASSHAPSIEAWVNTNMLDLWNFSLSTNVTIRVYSSNGGSLVYGPTVVTTNSSGHYLGFELPIDLVTGNYVLVTDSGTGNSENLAIEPITFTGMDLAADTYSGTASPNETVYVMYWDDINDDFYWDTTVANGSGNWSYDFTAIADLIPFGWYAVEVEDGDNDYSGAQFSFIRAHLEWDGVNIIDYSIGNTVTWTVKDAPAGNTLINAVQFSYAENWQWADSGTDLQPGYYVSVTDDLTGTVKNLTLAEVEITSVNLSTEVVTGTAPANSYVRVVATNWGDIWEALFVQANGSGDWTANFSGLVNLNTQIKIEVLVQDNDADETAAFWEPPFIEVDANGWVKFYSFTPSSLVDVELYETKTSLTPLWSGQITTDADGYYQMRFNELGCNYIVSGNYIKVLDTSSGIAKGLVYYPVDITTITETSAYVAGTSAPNEWIYVTGYDQDGWLFVWVQANGSGDWEADFNALKGSTLLASRVEAYVYDVDNDASYRLESGYTDDFYLHNTTLMVYGYGDGWSYNYCPGQDVRVFHGWWTTTTQFTQDYIDASQIDMTLDNVAQYVSYADARSHFTSIRLYVFWDDNTAQLVSGQVVYFYDDLGALPSGNHTLRTINTLSTQIDDGYDLYPAGVLVDATVTLNRLTIPLTALNGSAVITAAEPIVAIGRPHVGTEIMAYNGASGGATTVYLPMLFNNKWSYTSSFTVQNTGTGTATFDITFKDAADGSTSCALLGDSLPVNGVVTYDVTDLGTCNGGGGTLPTAWFGGATLTSDEPLVVTSRVNIAGTDAVTYNGFTGGAATTYLPMLFRGKWGYQSAFYIQNLDTALDATVSIDFYDAAGAYTCTYADPVVIGPSVTRGYWMANIDNSTQCLGGTRFDGAGWTGSAVITSTGSTTIVAIGRPHLGAEVAAYNGFTSGGTTNYLPMLFRGQWGYNSAFYIQNISAEDSTIAVTFYDTAGAEVCTYTDPVVLGQNATRGYWTPGLNCNDGSNFDPAGWAGSAKIVTSQNVIAVGRPHLSNGQVVVYNAFTGGATSAYVPLMFRQYSGSETALYIQNLGTVQTTATINYYDEDTGFYCVMEQVVEPGASGAIWLAGLDSTVCLP